MIMRLRFGVVVCCLACRVDLPPNARYSCATDEDCGGESYRCARPAGATSGTCCLPTGPEICDGIDNDCDGVVDDTGKAEICNGLDDNCDGRTDEGYNLQLDPTNCGACNHVCDPGQVCLGGVCQRQTENDCADGVDNDGNGLTDCADPSCNGVSCGSGCACADGGKTEVACHDRADNDGDGLVDCADPDCVGQSCGPGCACGADAGFTENVCNNAVDDDGDGLTDCADPDCAGKLCGTAAVPFTCSAGACNCHGGAQVVESGSLCSDGIDNDCNGKTDCADPTCAGQPCTAGGVSGSCSSGACH
jgi:hypothetical protein